MNDSITQEEVQCFYQNLATQLELGDSLTYALSYLISQEYNHTFRSVLEEVAESVNYGQSLCDALTPHCSVFEPEYVDRIREGEENGTLMEALRDAGVQ